MSYSIEQLAHDEINVKRLVRRLEKVVSDPLDESPGEATWIKAQGTLQVCSYVPYWMYQVD
jgi:SNARE protein 1